MDHELSKVFCGNENGFWGHKVRETGSWTPLGDSPSMHMRRADTVTGSSETATWWDDQCFQYPGMWPVWVPMLLLVSSSLQLNAYQLCHSQSCSATRACGFQCIEMKCDCGKRSLAPGSMPWRQGAYLKTTIKLSTSKVEKNWENLEELVSSCFTNVC